ESKLRADPALSELEQRIGDAGRALERIDKDLEAFKSGNALPTREDVTVDDAIADLQRCAGQVEAAIQSDLIAYQKLLSAREHERPRPYARLRDFVRLAILAQMGSTPVCDFRPGDPANANAVRTRLAEWGVPVERVQHDIDAILCESF